MNNIVNLSQLITRLAKVTNSDPNTARRFLRTFFATIEEALAEGDTIEIKGIGTFRRCDDPAVGTPGTVGFAPADDFAEEINRPFAVFEPVELADGLTAEDLEPETEEIPAEAPLAKTPSEINETVIEPEPEVSVPFEEAGSDTTTEPEEEHKAPWEIYGKGPIIENKEPETEKAIAETKDETIAGRETQEEVPSELEETAGLDETPEVEKEGFHRHTWRWIVAAILLVAGISGYFAAVISVPIPKYGEDLYEAETEQNETTVQTEPLADTTAIAEGSEQISQQPEQIKETAPEPITEEAPLPNEPKYDTVTSKRYLAIMAREYYGRSIYWVFIYEANANKLKNPNRVAPGTKVLIPDKESLPGTTDAERMAIAEKKASEIQARYK